MGTPSPAKTGDAMTRRPDPRQLSVPMPAQPPRARDVTKRTQNAIVFLRHHGVRVYRADDFHLLVNGVCKPVRIVPRIATLMGWQNGYRYSPPPPVDPPPHPAQRPPKSTRQLSMMLD